MAYFDKAQNQLDVDNGGFIPLEETNRSILELELSYLADQARDYMSNIDELNQRLQPILRENERNNVVDKGELKQVETPQTTLSSAIKEIRHLIQSQNQRLAVIINRVDLISDTPKLR